MTRVLIVTSGSHGDVHPFLAVGRALASRGATVDVLVNPHFEDDVRRAGLGFLPLGERLSTAELIDRYGVMHHTLGAMRVMKLLLQFAPLVIGRAREVVAAARPDVVLAHHICIGVEDVAREASIPCALALLSPGVMFSRRDPIPMAQGWPGATGRLFAWALFPVVELALLPAMNAMVNRARRLSGLPPMRDAARASWQGGDRSLALWSEAFRAAQSDDPVHVRTCGFAFYDGDPSAPLPDGLEDFLAAGEPPLLFCLGTTAVFVPGDFYRNAIEAARRLNRRALLLAGPDAAKLDGAADGVRAFGYAPLSRVAPRCAATVVHGGIGTTAQALRAGRPTLVAPFAHDQFNNGVRVHALGVGDSIQARRLNAKRMTVALDRLLSSESVLARSAALGERLRGEDGSARAADHLLSLL